MDVLLFYFEFVYVWSCWVFFAVQALLQLCRAETPGAVLGGSLGVLPSCGRGFSVAALLWAGFAGVLPSCGRGFSRCCPLAGRSCWGRRLQLFPPGAP